MTSKVHVSLDTKDINASVKYYSTLFNMQPTKLKPGYAKFDVADPAINLTLGQTSAATVTGPNHMGIRVSTLDEVIAAKDRLEKAGFPTMDEMGTTCCYAVQDKIWSADPSGNRWEVYIFKGDAESFGAPPRQNEAYSPAGACCSAASAAEKKVTASAAAKPPSAPEATQAKASQQDAPGAGDKNTGVAVACCAADSRTPEQQKTACC